MAEIDYSASYTVEQAAKLLAVTPRRIRQMVEEGSLAGERSDDGKWMFPQPDILRLRRERSSTSDGRQVSRKARVIDLREVGGTMEAAVEAAVVKVLNEAVPKAISAASREGKEERDAAIFEANARATTSEAKVAVAEHRAAEAEQKAATASAAAEDSRNRVLELERGLAAAQERAAAAERRASDIDQLADEVASAVTAAEQRANEADQRAAALQERAAQFERERNEINQTYIKNSQEWKALYETDTAELGKQVAAAERKAQLAEQAKNRAEEDLADLLGCTPREFKRHKADLRQSGYLQNS